jgi:hypothetical protein
MLVAPTTSRNLLVAAVIVAVFAAFGACANVEGTTPTCTNNVDDAGITAKADGCEQFATCDRGDATLCCQDDMGMPVEDYAACLFGYGVGPAPGGGGGGGGGGAGGGTGGGAGTGGTGGA